MTKQRPLAEEKKAEPGSSFEKDAPLTPMSPFASETLLQYRGQDSNLLQRPHPRHCYNLLVRGSPTPGDSVLGIRAYSRKLDYNVAHLDRFAGHHKFKIHKVSARCTKVC